MKFKMCACKWGGLKRPIGALKIERTEVVAPDVLVAEISGKVNAKVAVVREKGKYYVKAPAELGGKIEKVHAGSLTDCINYKTWEWNEELAGRKIPGKAAAKVEEKKK